jgi:tagatose 1,6-diphosphate aldolase GatY/KbaY
MIKRGIEPVIRARDARTAVGAFSVYNLEQAQGVCEAAELSLTPLIVQVPSSALRSARGRTLSRLTVAVAEQSGAAVGVHLDHARSLEEVVASLEAGYSSVMFDGSHLPIEENVELTAEVVRLARTYGAWVEGELAGIAGDEDRSSAGGAGPLTDPAMAERFVEATGIDALAVAIGNVHGFTESPVYLDLNRLAEIKKLVGVPLVLHGASGLEEARVRAAIEQGVAKINVNAELRVAFLRGFDDGRKGSAEDELLPSLTGALHAVRDCVLDKQRQFAGQPTGIA